MLLSHVLRVTDLCTPYFGANSSLYENRQMISRNFFKGCHSIFVSLQTLTPPETHVVPVSPIQEIQGNRTVPSTSSNSSPQPPEALEEQLLFTSHQEETAIYQTPVEASELSYTFSPPALIQTLGTQGESDATLAQTPAKPSLEYIFSPPLTRSMAKRRSFEMNPSDLSDLSGGWVLTCCFVVFEKFVRAY